MSPERAERTKADLREALDSFDDVVEDVTNDEYDPLDYAPPVYEEARLRLGISEFEDYTTVGMVLRRDATASQNPFLAFAISGWLFRERLERDFKEYLIMGGQITLTVLSMLVPGVVGAILKIADLLIGFYLDYSNITRAQQMLDMARLDIHGDIRGVSVEEAESALTWAWIGAIVNVALTAGPVAVRRALKVRGARAFTVSPDFVRWEKTLSEETQIALRADPELRRIFAEMGPTARRLLTMCGSPCIPTRPRPDPADIRAFERWIQKTGVPSDNRALREYFHHPGRRANFRSAFRAVSGAKNPAELQVLLDRAITGNVRVPGASATRLTTGPNSGKWAYTRPNGTSIIEHEIDTHGVLAGTRTNDIDNFFQSHHGIQDTWARDVGLMDHGYARDSCPAILLRDRRGGTPHQIITGRQAGRASGRATRSYADERRLLMEDMKAAGVPDNVAREIRRRSDAYFGGLYRANVGVLSPSELQRIFGTWRPR